jgi:hypothetical protein
MGPSTKPSRLSIPEFFFSPGIFSGVFSSLSAHDFWQRNCRARRSNRRKIMRRVHALLASLVLAGLLTESRSFCQTLQRDDTQALQGTWLPIKAELAGQAMPDVAGKIDKGTCKQDPAAKPKRLTIQGTEGPNAGKTFLCIYELDGDTFRVCYDLSGMKHPDDFVTTKGTLLYLVTYARKKD